MYVKVISLIYLSLQLCQFISGQDSISITSIPDNEKILTVNGFVRGGLYYDPGRTAKDPFFSSGFTDLGLKIETRSSTLYKAYADVRFRYGSEFHNPVNIINIREAYVVLNGTKWDISLGQKILKWGRADFTNPTSKFNPQNLVSRSPDHEDMDLGNILASVNWYPFEIINIQGVIVPFYRSSVLIIDPIPLPENTTIGQIEGLITDQQLLSYGFKTDFHFQGFDWSISWFNGFDPMPGISLSNFSLDLSGPIPVPITQLNVKPYRTRVLGIDFESVLGSVGIRGEAAWSAPFLSYKTSEYVPAQELHWVAGMDWSPGNWLLTGEYSGKFLPDFVSAGADPIIGTEPDYSKLAEMLSIPGFNLTEYVRQQVGAFNRLYNYQLKKYYHSAGLRIETDLLYGKIIPSVYTMYNFTSKDLLFIPEIRFKPADGLSIVAGAEIFSGKKGSLYDIVHEFMNSVYIALKVSF